MMDLRNNIFTYATKELSQDAFICWLCSYAIEDSVEKDKGLKDCAIDFISEFMNVDDADKDKIRLVDVQRQKYNIDVLLSVIYEEKLYKIIVEDKIHASERGDQLKRYKDTISKSEKVDEIIGVYYKTGFQSDYANVKKAGYRIVDRNKVISILKKHVNSTPNAILHDYFDYWLNFDAVTNSYSSNKPSNWDWRQINGFFDEMRAELIGKEEEFWVGYNYVPNKSGGFYGMWYGNDSDAIEGNGFKAAIYLQLEATWEEKGYEYRICLKLENQSEKDDKRFDACKWYIVDNISNYGFERPKRVGAGQHVTVGVITMEIDSYDSIKSMIYESINRYNRVLKDKDLMMKECVEK